MNKGLKVALKIGAFAGSIFAMGKVLDLGGVLINSLDSKKEETEEVIEEEATDVEEEAE